MNAFRKWLLLVTPVVAILAATAFLLTAKRGSHGSDDSDWLIWFVVTMPLYTYPWGARSRPCRRPRWLGGR